MWLEIRDAERDIVLTALTTLTKIQSRRAPEIVELIARISGQHSMYPDITVCVYGGMVQEISGNPFPIRVCDYDGDPPELLDRDADGNRCHIWYEEASP